MLTEKDKALSLTALERRRQGREKEERGGKERKAGEREEGRR